MTWFGAGAGGVAYLNSFGATEDRTAFVFQKELGDGFPKFIWEATSHEIGHTFGLYHDGDSNTEYYGGHDTYAPIMGVAYNRPVSQFSKGDYLGANNKQDDFWYIRQYLRPTPDYHADSIVNATLLTNKTKVYGTMGIFDKADIFKINVAGGKVFIQADVSAPWGSVPRANLDLSLTILNSKNAPIAYSNPYYTLSAGITVNSVARGTYYVQVKRTGKGTPTTGYTAYGSVGQYSLTAKFNQVG